MKENLKTTRLNNNTTIKLVTVDTAWYNTMISGYCWYNNDSATYKNTYGALYNWYTVSTGKLCPAGYHVPTDSEWTTLTDTLGGESVAGSKMKEAGTVHWLGPNADATNESEFTGLPGGYRDRDGTFACEKVYGYWWSSTAWGFGSAWYRGLYYVNGNVYNNMIFKNYGYSVRCVKDSSAVIIKNINYDDNIKIYPNPANYKIIIDCLVNQKTKLQIYNMLGECILQRELYDKTSKVDINSLADGIYIIKLTGNNWTVQRKLIKNKTPGRQ